VRLYSRPGNDLTHRFPLIAETLARLRSRSCIIDGEAVACDDNGVASFNLIRYRRHDDSTFLYAFDPDRTERRRSAARCVRGSQATLASIVAKASPGIRFNEHTEGDGPTIFAHACKMALEGIVSKAKGLPLSFRPFARLAQNEERECTGREAGRGRGLGAPRNPIILDAALGPHEALNRAR